MTKAEKQELMEEIRIWVVRSLIAAIVAPIVGVILGALTFLTLAPNKLEAQQLAIEDNRNNISCLENEVKSLRVEMNSNQKEILNILRHDYTVK